MQNTLGIGRWLLSLGLIVAALLSAPLSAFAGTGAQIQLEGRLEVRIQDYHDRAVTRYFLKPTNGQRLELRFQRRPASLRTGAKVLVTGWKSGGKLEVAYLSSTSSTSSSAAASSALYPTYGPQKILAILVNFQDKPTEQPWTASQVRTFMSGALNDFVVENSYGLASVAADVSGWHTIPVSSTVCSQTGVAREAKAAAAAAGIDVSAYTRFIFLHPRSACAFDGASTVGGNPSQAWINGKLTLQVVGHELGHSFGLDHSVGLSCPGTTLGTGTDCTTMEYGDTVDPMGNAPTGHFNAYQKERLGWLDAGVTTVETSGTYTIDTFEAPGAQPKALRVLKSVDATTGWKTWYYIELRQPIGLDTWMSNNLLANASNIFNGVVIHAAPDPVRVTSRLLDMTPETQHLRDPALVVGRSYVDSDAGVAITTDAVGNGTATVTVNLSSTSSSCTHADPTLAVSTPTTAVSAGSTISYTVTATNNDSPGCGSNSFNLSRTLPSGWSGAFAASSLSLSPGQSSSTTLSVTSPTSAGAGTYPISISATNAGASTYTSTTASSYSVSAIAALSVSVKPGKSVYTRSETVSITASVTQGTAPVAGATVTFEVIKSNGSKVTKRVATDRNGTATYLLRLSRSKDPAGSYEVHTSATNGAASGEATATFEVQ